MQRPSRQKCQQQRSFRQLRSDPSQSQQHGLDTGGPGGKVPWVPRAAQESGSGQEPLGFSPSLGG